MRLSLAASGFDPFPLYAASIGDGAHTCGAEFRWSLKILSIDLASLERFSRHTRKVYQVTSGRALSDDFGPGHTAGAFFKRAPFV